jgi:hypothetical protein
LSEETDLDLLNLAMDKMVEHFQEDLIPVAAQLTAKLVSHDFSLMLRTWITY